MVGGGTRSAVMMQSLADVTGRRLEVVADGPLVAARGAALLAGVGSRPPRAPPPRALSPRDAPAGAQAAGARGRAGLRGE